MNPTQEKAAAPAKRTAALKTDNAATDNIRNDRLQAVISCFESATAANPCGQITITDFLRDMNTGTHAAKVERIRQASTAEEIDRLKKLLPSVSLSGRVTSGGRGKAFPEGRFEHSGWLQIDLDAKDFKPRSPVDIRAEIGKDEHVIAAFLSPTGTGVKALCRVPVCKTPDEHMAAFKAAEAYFLECYGLAIDPSTKDPVRFCFVSYDPDAVFHDWKTPCTMLPMGDTTAAEVIPHGLPIGRPHRSKVFPLPPESGVHSPWLPQAAWWCRFEGLSESDAVAKIRSCEGMLRPGRRFQPTEPEDACRLAYSTILQSRGTRAMLRELPLPADFPDLTRFGESDADNALRVHAVAGGNFHHVSETGQWLVWDGWRWTPDKDGKMVRLFLNVMEGTAKQSISLENRKAGEALVRHAMRCRDAAKVASGLTMLKSVQGVTISANDLDADPWVIGTPNGMINLRTGEAIPPEKNLLVTKSIACDLEPEAACPTWERVIHTAAAGDAELIRFLQAWTGYTLTGSVKEECLAFLHGTGANSKGTVTECIRALMGDYALTAPESLFTADRNSNSTNDIARLAGCRMACAAELDENSSFAESRLKAITGRDAITARFLHREFFDFVPTHKLWISGNHKPSVRGVDHGIWRRIRLIPFTVTIPKEERDLNLADKLRDELPGILQWALDGCLIWQREGLKTPQCVAKATADYQAAEDVVGQFLDDTTENDTEARTLQSSLFEAYQGWAESQGIRKPMSATMLNRKLEERGLRKIKVTGGRFWKGITTKTN